MILENTMQEQLRASGVIGNDEVAMQVGDLHVAENVLTKERRMIKLQTNNSNISESSENRSLLKG